MAGIQEYLDLIKNAIYGKDVRQAIHDGILQCYLDASGDHYERLDRNKVNQPLDGNNQPTNGTNGQILRTKGNGATEWSDVGLPTDEQTSQAVSDWLDEHPDATTTVQDGSLTEPKFSNALKLKTIKDYVTPEMFGAKGDGVTDDSDALQNAIDFGFDNRMPVHLLGKNYLITKPLIMWTALSHVPTGNNTLGVSRLIGAGEGKTVITKRGNVTSGITGQDVDCIIQIADERYRDPSFSTSDDDTVCRVFEISELSIRHESNDEQTPTIDYGIFSVGWFFATFRDITITGCKSGMGTRRWNCYSRYIRVDINFAQVGFNFALSPIGSGGQTTMLFDSCHTNGCKEYSYSLCAKATLINCSNDGGMATFINAPESVSTKQNAMISVIDCHCESLNSNGLIRLTRGKITVIGGYYEIPEYTDSALFDLYKDASMEIRDAFIISRDNSNSVNNNLYSLGQIASIHFDNCYVNNAIFASPQPIRHKTHIVFDCGVNNLGGTASDLASDSITVGNTIDVEVVGSGEHGNYLYLGEIDTNEYSALRMICESSFPSAFVEVSFRLADSVSNNKPSGNIINKPLGLNAVFNPVTYGHQYYSSLSKADSLELIGSRLDGNGKKHLFIHYYSNVPLTATIYKIWLE